MADHDGRRTQRPGRRWGPASTAHDGPAPPPLITETGVGVSLRRRRGGLPVWGWIVGAVTVVAASIALALTAEAPNDESTDAASTNRSEPPMTAPAATDAPAATTAPADTTGSHAEPVVSATIGEPFVFEEREGVAWEVSIAGLIEAPSEGGGGSCLVALGTLTPTAATGAVSSPFSTPTISLEFEDEIIDDTVGDCDTTAVETAGYSWILDAVVTPGTPFAFFAEFWLAESEKPDSIRAGNLFDESAVSLAPILLDAIPKLPPTSGQRADVERQPMGDPSLSTSTYTDFDGAAWDVSVTGLIETATRRADEGRCLLALGVMTPTLFDGSVSDPFTTPAFGLVVNGRLIDSTAVRCDTDAVTAAGYGWRLDAEVTADTPYPFYVEFIVPADAGPVDLLVVGLPAAPEATFYEATILDDIPVVD